MSGDCRRYPADREIYCKTVGQTRVENIAEAIRSLGFIVLTAEPEDDDVDILMNRNRIVSPIAIIINAEYHGKIIAALV
jgi:hypothetical protein